MLFKQKNILSFNQSKIQIIIILSMLLLILIAGSPFVFTLFPYFPNKEFIYILGFLPLVYIILKQRIVKLDRYELYWASCIQIFVWLLLFFLHDMDMPYISQVRYIFQLLILLLIIENFNLMNRVINAYVYIITIMCLLGMITFFLVLFFNFSPLFEYINVDERTGYNFILSCTNGYYGRLIRYSGFFDEPGAIANWGIWALVMNKLVTKSKKCELLLVVSLIFTFSMAYYIQVSIYFLFLYMRSLKQIFLIFLLFFPLYIYVDSLQYSDDNTIYKITIQRFKEDDSGNVRGNNRLELADRAKSVFCDHPFIGVGATNIDILNREAPLVANFYTPLARDGIIGLITVYLIIIIIIFQIRKSAYLLKLLFVLLIGFIQRPLGYNIYPLFMVILLYSSFKIYNENRNSNSKLLI